METDQLVDFIDERLSELASEWNGRYSVEPLMVRIIRYTHRERKNAGLRRVILSTAFWSLSTKVRREAIEVFLLPAPHIAALPDEETIARLKFKLTARKKAGQILWFLDNTPVAQDDLRMLLRTCFRDMTNRSLQAAKESGAVDSIGSNADVSLTGKVRALISDKHHLSEKLVAQQENLLAELSRNMHDAVLGRLMVLQSYLEGSADEKASTAVQELESITRTIREICQNLAPRDLQDWGLPVVIEDLLESLAEQTGADCDLVLEGNLDIDKELQLHVFRIIQESLTNIHKHAKAKKVRVLLDQNETRLVVEIRDDGRGFITHNVGSGIGFSSMRERVDLMQSRFPTAISVTSSVNNGTVVRLEIALSKATADSDG
jgi:signal transduction histidine kinase